MAIVTTDRSVTFAGIKQPKGDFIVSPASEDKVTLTSSNGVLEWLTN